jgi:hypothetical protein
MVMFRNIGSIRTLEELSLSVANPAQLTELGKLAQSAPAQRLKILSINSNVKQEHHCPPQKFLALPAQLFGSQKTLWLNQLTTFRASLKPQHLQTAPLWASLSSLTMLDLSSSEFTSLREPDVSAAFDQLLHLHTLILDGCGMRIDRFGFTSSPRQWRLISIVGLTFGDIHCAIDGLIGEIPESATLRCSMPGLPKLLRDRGASYRCIVAPSTVSCAARDAPYRACFPLDP